MKKIIAVFISLIVGLYFLTPISRVSAEAVCPPGYERLCTIDVGKNPNIFGQVVQIVLVIAIILSVIFLILGGIKWITSGGDKGKVDQARSAITASIIGLVISFAAYFIITMLVYIFTGKLELNLEVPKLVTNFIPHA